MSVNSRASFVRLSQSQPAEFEAVQIRPAFTT